MNPSDRRAALAAANEILKSGWTKHELATRRRLERAARLDKMRKKALAARDAAPRPSIRPAEPDGVYIIGSPGGPVKVGVTCNIHGRLKSLQTGCPDRLRVYLHVENLKNARAIERAVHSRLSDFAKTGEWFEIEWREAARIVRDEIERSRARSAPNRGMIAP